ncbi:ascorbate utilization transcriptional regulator UlaR HTH-type [Vibrio maritimus]|uniref:Ascorbate utilization transcriptional regulator UlaR HTH-type n=1 Tax=Vibrio maritimus TaxID=990268 RepID=A0A090RYZ0_9VIBR|nr:ascorbate utilization transcriptional regulator UlaR HTH-type [Vibrio maritimus]
MNELQRHDGILSLLDEKRVINVAHIIENFDVSPATARRDIAKLDELGKLKKVRNGAERIEQNVKTGALLISTLLTTITRSHVSP